MTGNVHEVDVGVADELDLGGFKEAVVILADESSVFNGFLGEILNVGLGTDYSDIGGIAMMALVRESNVLADEHADTDPGHVEAIEERLDGAVNLHSLALALVLEDTLCHGRDDAIMSSLDVMKSLRKPLVVEMQVGRPITRVVHHCKVPSRETLDPTVSVTIVLETAPAGLFTLID